MLLLLKSVHTLIVPILPYMTHSNNLFSIYAQTYKCKLPPMFALNKHDDNPGLVPTTSSSPVESTSVQWE